MSGVKNKEEKEFAEKLASQYSSMLEKLEIFFPPSKEISEKPNRRYQGENDISFKKSTQTHICASCMGGIHKKAIYLSIYAPQGAKGKITLRLCPPCLEIVSTKIDDNIEDTMKELISKIPSTKTQLKALKQEVAEKLWRTEKQCKDQDCSAWITLWSGEKHRAMTNFHNKAAFLKKGDKLRLLSPEGKVVRETVGDGLLDEYF